VNGSGQLPPEGDPVTENAIPSDSPPAAPAVADASENLRAYKSGGAWLRFLIPAILGLAADLALKAWSFPDGVPTDAMVGAGRTPAGFTQPEVIIPNVLRFTTTVNHGAVFGFGQGYVLVFLAFSLVALGIILWVFLTSLKHQWTVHLALGLITAGALGNLWDRAVHHGVRDMLQFNASWYQYIFNLADVLLCIGVPLLMVRWLFMGDGPAKKPSAALESPAQPR
jgi:signal peptidase II